MPVSSTPTNNELVQARPDEAGSAVIAPDARFIALLNGFRSSGGIAAMRELRRRARWTLGTRPSFEQWQSEARILAIEWNGESWFPLLQFQRISMNPEPVMQCVLAEFHGILGAWDVAAWLITPTVWLEGMTPASLVRADPAGVIRAARAERFLST